MDRLDSVAISSTDARGRDEEGAIQKRMEVLVVLALAERTGVFQRPSLVTCQQVRHVHSDELLRRYTDEVREGAVDPHDPV